MFGSYTGIYDFLFSLLYKISAICASMKEKWQQNKTDHRCTRDYREIHVNMCFNDYSEEFDCVPGMGIPQLYECESLTEKIYNKSFSTLKNKLDHQPNQTEPLFWKQRKRKMMLERTIMLGRIEEEQDGQQQA